jgi:hypothetical protein
MGKTPLFVVACALKGDPSAQCVHSVYGSRRRIIALVDESKDGNLPVVARNSMEP